MIEINLEAGVSKDKAEDIIELIKDTAKVAENGKVTECGVLILDIDSKLFEEIEIEPYKAEPYQTARTDFKWHLVLQDRIITENELLAGLKEFLSGGVFLYGIKQYRKQKQELEDTIKDLKRIQERLLDNEELNNLVAEEKVFAQNLEDSIIDLQNKFQNKLRNYA